MHEDFSLVTSARPAVPGEVLIIRAKGLGPTRPDLRPVGLVRFGSNPIVEVNSPVEIAVDGKEAEVLNKVGWPGETDVYRVDFRMPSGTSSGMGVLQVTAAWIPGTPVAIPVK
jgi:uncharacterized protein (TIGR03437 family)